MKFHFKPMRRQPSAAMRHLYRVVMSDPELTPEQQEGLITAGHDIWKSGNPETKRNPRERR